MAFMVPVMKKDFDLYKNRRISESVPTRKMSADTYKASSMTTSPSSASAPAYGSPSGMAAFTQRMQNRAMTRTSSRASQNSLVTSPTRVNMTSSSSAGNTSSGCSPPKAGCSKPGGSQGSLNKFHNRLVDKLKRSLKRETKSEASRS